MMKIIAFALILIVLQTKAYSQRYSSADFYLKGPVHKLIQLQFESDELYSKNKYSTMDTIIFQPDRSLKYNRRYRANGELLVEEKTEQNQNNRIVKYSRYQMSLKYLKEKYVYNESQNLTTKSIFENDDLIRIYKMYYDSIGNMIQMNTLDSMLFRNSESTYEYDKDNKLISSVTNNLKSKSATQREYVYDSKLRRTKIVESNPINNKTSTTQYKYDAKGNQISYQTTRSNGNVRESITEYQYYDDYYEKMGFSSEGYQDTYFKLDYNDNIITRIFYNSDGNVRNTSNYILDQHGNWIKETFIADGFYAISVRTIEYFSQK